MRFQTSWPQAKLPAIQNRFVVVAHRGDHTAAPENTLTALHNTIKAGADYMEIDLRTTRDGQIVLMHDSTVDRMTNGKGKIAELTLKEIQALKVVDSRPNLPVDSVRNELVPTFEAVLEAARPESLHFYLDCKAIDPQQVVQLLKRFQMERRVIAFNGVLGCRAWKKVAPDIPVMTSFPATVKTPSALELLWRQDPVEVIDGASTRYTPELVSAAHRWGAQVWPDIQGANESPMVWEPVVKMGVDGLQTDHPGALIAYLKSIGKR